MNRNAKRKFKISLKKEDLDLNKFFQKGHLSFVFTVLFIALVLAAIVFGPVHYSGRIRVGEISLRSIYAPYDFRYPWGVNEKRTKESREELIKSIPDVYDIEGVREEDAVKNFVSLFDALQAAGEIQDKAEKKLVIETLNTETGLDIRDNVLEYFTELKDAKEIKEKLVSVLSSLYPLGIIDPETRKKLIEENLSVRIRNPKIKTERIRPSKELFTPEDAEKVASEYIDRMFPKNSKLRKYSIDLVTPFITHNLVFNEQLTTRIKEEALKNATPIYDMLEIKKNELVIERGQRITKQHIAQLTQLGALGGISRKGPYLSGILFLLIVLIGVGITYLAVTEKKIITSPKNVSIILINCLILIVISQFLIQAPYPDYVIPLSGCAMLVALLVNANTAFIVSIIFSIFLGVVAGGKIEIIIALFVAGFIGAYMVRDARRRSRIILAGIVSGAASMFAIMAIGLLNNLDFKIYMYEALWGFAGGVFSIFWVMGFLPLFEYLFKTTTNITLLELSDLNHPLLKELTLNAPGTYQHCVVVGNLADAACEAIGANSLLAKVGAYYHDIGKIEKGEYFSENEMGAQSKHSKLTPSMSALIITNHVKDGIDLAKKYNLNPKVIDFIAQHHGTGLIYYFYQRALEKVKDNEVLNEDEFRYPGPKPQTKEAAIVLLADSVEASSRALSDPTPGRIRGLVQKIINNKFIDNQLDECDLTLKDLNKIAASFVRVLTAVFHTRLDYPKNNKKKNGNGMKKFNFKGKFRTYGNK